MKRAGAQSGGLLAALLVGAVTGHVPGAFAQPVPTVNGGQLQVKVRSLAELRFTNMERQSRDLSCGAAALATLLRHGYGLPADEGQIIEEILGNAPDETRAKIAEQGFSLLELKRYLETRGFAAGGFQLDRVEQLANLKVPVIALVNVRGYNHFVVIKRIKDDRVLIADPAFGNTRPPLSTFEGQWNGIILAAARADLAPRNAFMEDPTIRARPGDLRSIAAALGTAELTLPGEF